MKLPSILFHGTSTGYLDQMLRDGLDPRSSYKGYLGFTNQIAIAEHHAEHMTDWDGSILKRVCHPVVFAIPISAFTPAHFCLDENFIELRPSAGRRAGLNMDHLLGTWRQVLQIAGAVGYRRLLKVDHTMMMRQVAPRRWPRPARFRVPRSL